VTGRRARRRTAVDSVDDRLRVLVRGDDEAELTSRLARCTSTRHPNLFLPCLPPLGELHLMTIVDLLGIGFGPSNLSVAVAAAESEEPISMLFVDWRQELPGTRA
jgi:hypothetical protein